MIQIKIKKNDISIFVGFHDKDIFIWHTILISDKKTQN